MRVFIAIASGETQYTKGYRSCLEIARRDGDTLFVPDEASYGSVTRPGMLSAFRRMPEYDAYLALDADQKHPRDLLERLRARLEADPAMDMVCAHYYRRTTGPVQSLCYELGDGTWPFLPMLTPPTEGLHELASTGQGCVLIRRRVIEAVWATLAPGDNPFTPAPIPEVGGDQRVFGSDMRFFILARRLGFRLWLDADIESLHAVTVWLGHRTAAKLADHARWADNFTDVWRERLRLHGVNAEAIRQRLRLLDARHKGLTIEYEEAFKSGNMQSAEEHVKALLTLDGMIKESVLWLESIEKYPAIERADQLPTTASDPLFADDSERTAELRSEVHKENARDLVRELPRVETGRNGVGSG